MNCMYFFVIIAIVILNKIVTERYFVEFNKFRENVTV